MPAALRLRWRGQAWFEHAGLPASRSCGAPVSVGPAVSGWAGEGAAGSQVSGVVVQIRGGSVIVGPCLVSLPALVSGLMPWCGAVARARRGPVEGPLHNKLALLLALA